MFKKTILAAVALTFIGAPLAQAQNYPHKPGVHRMEPQRKDFNRHAQRPHWSKGQRYSDWRRHAEVRDYKRYGLRRPAPGQRWVKVDNDYLLITTATGIIAGMLAAR